MKRVVTFGEVMLRLGMPSFRKFTQAVPGPIEATFAGAEANVAASLATLGRAARFVTALPRHPIADACVADLRRMGVDTEHVLRTDTGRLGVFYLEAGANQRPSRVVYDRQHTAIATTPPDAYDWDAAFADADWLHVSGITPALSSLAAESTAAAVRVAKSKGLGVSCDLNFRKKLWDWREGVSPDSLAREVMSALVESVDLVVGNEEDYHSVLGIEAGHTDVDAGDLDIDSYPDVARSVVAAFPSVRHVAITLRYSRSATHNDWGAMLYSAQRREACFAPQRGGEYRPYEIRGIVDRVGAGDSFAAGLVFALGEDTLSEPESAIAFATASSCLAHSLPGDFNHTCREEVEALVRGGGSGRVQR